MLAALQCFQWMFTALATRRVWIHIAAEMQAGKTGVVTALIRLMLKNAQKLRITPDRIFVLTGMSDDAWKKQTQVRLPACLRANVHHNGGLSKTAAKLISLNEREGGLRNILIVLDESHIASAKNNLPNKLIYCTIRNLVPVSEWEERNIRFITISATDPAKVLVMASSEVPCRIVRLQTTADYQSVRTLKESGRVRPVGRFGDIHTDAAVAELKRAVSTFTTPRYHILRVRAGKHADCKERLEREFPGCRVEQWDATRKATGGSEEASTVSMKDINELLEQEPPRTTFILLKNMFYAAKTVEDKYVGVFWDRVGGKDDTNLQSLLGRACGYGKSKDTIIYCSEQTVDNYISFWKELCSNPEFPAELEVPVNRVDKKMAGIKATAQGGAGCKVGASVTYATPFSGGGSGSSGGGGSSSTREVANENDFDHEWKEFATWEEARAWGGSTIRRVESGEDGFVLSSADGPKKKLRYDDIMRIKSGKKTANMDWKKLKSLREGGRPAHRLYVGYRNEHDATTAVYVVRRLWKK